MSGTEVELDRPQDLLNALPVERDGAMGLGLGLAACQKGLSVGFTAAAALVHELIEARDDKQLLRFQKRLASYKLLIIDELGFVPLSKTGAELRDPSGRPPGPRAPEVVWLCHHRLLSMMHL